ncbi:hypothetical protein PACTADRAFT_3600 [Pachysolen tannophilus NRRL Y-2460]|uniref:Dynein light chain n=1 Tax=Pachysolen tannophilus NRRL Y-2460 TaxID=669874 RepID=A0A1E4TSK0_PACTA|nr:hypothetical protein PACTADRAFT_3600 [Pachysolen tannophilus NRRL Y-2460]
MSTPVVKSSDMPEELQSKVFELSLIAVKKFTVEKEIANYLKKEMDALCGPMWHCIVGKNFGSYVTHGEYY